MACDTKCYALGNRLSFLCGVSIQLIRLVQKQSDEHQNVGVSVADILRLLDSFQEANTSYVRRSGNGVAHSIAQKAVRGSKCSTWEFGPPSLWLLSTLHG